MSKKKPEQIEDKDLNQAQGGWSWGASHEGGTYGFASDGKGLDEQRQGFTAPLGSGKGS